MARFSSICGQFRPLFDKFLSAGGRPRHLPRDRDVPFAWDPKFGYNAGGRPEGGTVPAETGHFGPQVPRDRQGIEDVERMTDSTDEDRPLVHRARSGDFAAFESLMARYERRVYGLALRIVGQLHDAEEVVQQTFLSVIEHLGGFREQARFSTWLTRIATNHALALLRKRSRQQTIPLGEEGSEDRDEPVPHPEFIAQWAETPEQIATRRETRRLLDQALEDLDEKYRLVFVLRDVEGLSTAETAEALGISISNVKVRLLRARLMLRERLTRQFGDETTRAFPQHKR